MDMQVFTYQDGVCNEMRDFDDLPKALLFVEGLRGMAEKFSIFFSNGSTLFGIYREGKGNLGLYEV